MNLAEFNAIPVVDSLTDALALSVTVKGGAVRKFLLADTVDGKGVLVSGVNSQQNRGVGYPDANRVSYFERHPQEKCCGTHGTVTTKHSASFGLDRVYPGPYPGIGHVGYIIKSVILS